MGLQRTKFYYHVASGVCDEGDCAVGEVLSYPLVFPSIVIEIELNLEGEKKIKNS